MARNSHDALLASTTSLRSSLNDVTVRLDERRALAAEQPGLDLAHEADEERRQSEHQEHLYGLHRKCRDHGHTASTRRRPTSETKTKPR